MNDNAAPSDHNPSPRPGDLPLADLWQLLNTDSTPDPQHVAAFWRTHLVQEWKDEPELYRLIGLWLIKNGDALLGYDAVTEGLEYTKDDVRLRQLQGLALARTGASNKANEVLSRLRMENHADEETLGILARTHKDRAQAALDEASRRREWRNALEIYSESFSGDHGRYWSGINVATLSLLLGETQRAFEVAGEVMAQCMAALSKAAPEDGDFYWILATLGEAALVRGEVDSALGWYSQAVRNSHGQWGSVSSTRRQARLIAGCLGGEHGAIEKVLRVPSVVVFVGHMVDQLNRVPPRFPGQLENVVKEALRERLTSDEIFAGFGYSSAACGSDILFQEVVRDLGGQTHIVLPYPAEFFAQDSVTSRGEGWDPRFQEVCRQASEKVEASPHRLTWGGVTYDYANLLLLGLAAMHAEQLQTELIPLAVWDGKEGDGYGGTSTNIERWLALGYGVQLINLADILESHGFPPEDNRLRGMTALAPADPSPPPPALPEIKALLFADVKGFSKLTEEQIFAFGREVLPFLAELIAAPPNAPLISHTWGDGIFCVFNTVQQAGLCSLAIRDGMRQADWSRHGLPSTISLRIALHAGPVFPCRDPMAAQLTYLGTHVNMASRIEPITPEGEVYASWAFAALAQAESATGFACDYAGRILWDKTNKDQKDGRKATYRVRRKNGPET